jgi:alpha-L-arabinofuranosidase
MLFFHTHATDAGEIVIRLKGGAADQVTHMVLTTPESNAHNTFEQLDKLIPRPSSSTLRGSDLRCTVPPASVNRFDIRLE